MDVRHILEDREKRMLSPHACLSTQSRGRVQPESPDPIRTVFQVDCDRILHSKAFRRLKYKTQVFLSPEGDHYRTRLTHTLEVSQIARTISRALALNEDLTEAIALGHDLGHTPFGHAGERVLNDLAPDGFQHVAQSQRVVELLENDGAGLNLTFEVVDGIRKHSKGQGPLNNINASFLPQTLEGQIVRFADIIAYVNHDLDDALRAGLILESKIPATIAAVLGNSCHKRIDAMVADLVQNVLPSFDGQRIRFSDEVDFALISLRSWLCEHVYRVSGVEAEFEKASRLLRELFDYFMSNQSALVEYGGRIRESEPFDRSVVDFIAGMTDRFATKLYHEIFLPQPWRVI
jgi:dGTPase